jgi:hypothetical protein
MEKWQLTKTKRKARQVKSKVKNMLITIFNIKGIIRKNSAWQASQFRILLWHFMVTA